MIEARDANQHVGHNKVVQMRVEGVGKSSNGALIFLNTEKDWKSPLNFTAVLSVAVQAKLKDDGVLDFERHFLRKTIRVRGLIESFQERPQIRIDQADQLEIAPD
jgi:hypothetical protein